MKKAFLDKLDLTEDQRQGIQAALQVCLAEGAIAFELNASHFPREVRLRIGGGSRDLVVDWAPILEASGAIDRFLIVFHDVTDWKKLESFQFSQNEMLSKLEQMAKADSRLLRKFLAQTERKLDIHLSSSAHVETGTIFRNIFIDIHTLKGEARSLAYSDTCCKGMTATKGCMKYSSPCYFMPGSEMRRRYAAWSSWCKIV